MDSPDVGGREWVRPVRRGPAPWLVWAAVLSLVAGMAVLQHLSRQWNEAPGRAARSASNPGLKLISRYAVAVSRLAAIGGKTGATSQGLAQQVRSAAHSPLDRLRAATVIGELDGPGAATRMLEDLRPELPPDLREDCDSMLTVYQEGADRLEAGQQEQLQRRHGWYAELAMSSGLAPGDPRRQQVMATATRTALGIVGIFVAGFGALAIGICLMILGLVLLTSGRLPLRYRPRRSYGTVLLEVFGWFLVAVPVAGIGGAMLSAATGVDVVWVLVWLVPGVLLWARIRGMSWRRIGRAAGWHSGRGWWREARAGIVGLIGGLPLVLLGILVTLALSMLLQQQPEHPFAEEALRGGGWRIAQIYLLACLWAPIVEEVAFRGLLYSHLRQRHGLVFSGVVTGVIFAGIHPQGIAAIPTLTCLAMVFAFLREWRESIIAPAVAHAVNNGVAVTVTLLLLR